MADNSVRIREIREILESGVTEDEVDGQRVRYDHRSLRKELQRLLAEDDVGRMSRPRSYRIHLGSFR